MVAKTRIFNPNNFRIIPIFIKIKSTFRLRSKSIMQGFELFIVVKDSSRPKFNNFLRKLGEINFGPLGLKIY